MERITTKHLETLLQRLRRETGAPEMRWVPRADGKGMECPIGAYFIDPGSQTHGFAWALVQTRGDAYHQFAGVRTILKARTARELYHLMHAYLDGYAAAPKDDLW